MAEFDSKTVCPRCGKREIGEAPALSRVDKQGGGLA